LPIKTGASGVLEVGAFGTGAGQFAEGNHTHAQLHDRSHAITSTSDHTAGNWKVFYSNGSGAVTELALGASGKVLQSNGASAAPTWETAGGGSGDVVGPASSVDNSIAIFDGTTGKLVQDSGVALTPGTPAVKEVYTLDFSGVSFSTLYASNVYLTLYTSSSATCGLWWYDSATQNAQPPGVPTSPLIQVTIDSSVDTLATALTATTAEINSSSEFSATLTGSVITVTVEAAGVVDDPTHTNVTNLAITVTTQGAAATLASFAEVDGSNVKNIDVLNIAATGSPASGFLSGGGSWQPIEQVVTNDRLASLGLVIDGAGSAITTGVKGYLRVPYACTIQSAELVADQSGSIAIDIWRDTYANFPPTVADSIVASAKPTLSSAQKSQNTSLTGWTTTLTEGQYLAFNVDSASTVTRVALTLKVQKDA
jgi:hypothetical protein